MSKGRFGAMRALKRASLKQNLRLTPLQFRAQGLIDRDELTVDELAQLLQLTEAAAYRVALALVQKGTSRIEDGRLVSTWGGIRR